MIKTVYKCSACGHIHQKWSGKCQGCGAWNSLLEDILTDKKKASDKTVKKTAISSAHDFLTSNKSETGMLTGFKSLDNVLGKGILPDQFILIGGEPGIGKSTLLSQMALNISKTGKHVMYFSGEESCQQIGLRIKRIQQGNTEKLDSFYLVNETDIDSINNCLKERKPDLVIIDSVQTLSSVDAPGSTGSPNLIKFIAEQLLETAKTLPTAIILIGHVTKDGSLAGPKTLEHIVDTVINIDGDRYHSLRMVRSIKNRFGSVDEISIFGMGESGLMEITNPAEILLENRNENAIGSVLTCSMEGSRPLVTEIQALTNPTNFGYPKRTSSGIKINRLHLICAVLQKYSKIKLESSDAYINVVGGIDLQDPATDLAILMSLSSSFRNKPLGKSFAASGEVGLSGEIRKMSNLEKRVKELEKAGIETILIPDVKLNSKAKLIRAKNIIDALKLTDIL